MGNVRVTCLSLLACLLVPAALADRIVLQDGREFFGDVRKTDTATIARVVAGLVARICVNLPGACGSLDDDAASAMFDRILAVDGAIGLLQDDAHRADWI